jgi:hypothetical protein
MITLLFCVEDGGVTCFRNVANDLPIVVPSRQAGRKSCTLLLQTLAVLRKVGGVRELSNAPEKEINYYNSLHKTHPSLKLGA